MANVSNIFGTFPSQVEEDVDISSTDYTPTGGSFRALYVGVSGDVVYKDTRGVQHTKKAMAGGVYHAMAGTMIVRTSTTATNMQAVLR